MNFIDGSDWKRIRNIWHQHQRKLLPFSAVLVIAGLVSVFYSNCGNFDPLKRLDSSSTTITNTQEFEFASQGSAIGNVEGMVDDGKSLILSGWACIVGSNVPATLEVGASGGDSFGTTTSTIKREAAVKTACVSDSDVHGFSFKISEAQRNSNAGKMPYVKLGGTNISLEPGLSAITAVPTQPIDQKVVGYLENIFYGADGSLTATGWACLQGTDEKVDVSLFGFSSLSSGKANLPAGPGIQAACGSPSGDHGFSIYVSKSRLQDVPVVIGMILHATARSGSKSAPLIGTFPYIPNAAANTVLPFTANMTPWTGPGGSSWNHSATLQKVVGANSHFSIYSSSSNPALNPTVAEFLTDVVVTGSGGCHEVGQEVRLSTTNGDRFEVTVRACFTKLSAINNWDITFDHRTVNTTNPAPTPADFGADHGTIRLSPSLP